MFAVNSTFIFTDFTLFALRSASANFRTCENITMTSYVCFEPAE